MAASLLPTHEYRRSFYVYRAIKNTNTPATGHPTPPFIYFLLFVTICLLFVCGLFIASCLYCLFDDDQELFRNFELTGTKDIVHGSNEHKQSCPRVTDSVKRYTTLHHVTLHSITITLLPITFHYIMTVILLSRSIFPPIDL